MLIEMPDDCSSSGGSNDSIDDAIAPILGVQYQMTAHHLVVLMIA